MRLAWIAFVAGLCLLLVACAPQTDADGPAPLEITRAEAVRAGWDSPAPPATGWTPVKLMDFWDARWPRHDGVVWYRVRWQQSEAQPTGLLVNYVCLASAVYLNGSLIARDPSLVEPLSRNWIKPQHFLLDAPLLRRGENTLLVRVSGLSAYQPGFGTVTVGDPAAVRAQYDRAMFKRFHIKLVNMAMGVVLGGIFLVMWLMRRQDSTYGWFALTELTGSLYGYNYLAPGIWPFPTTDAWQAFIAAMYVAAGASYAMFLLRYGERRYPRIEKAMGVAALGALGLALLFPAWTGLHRTLVFLVGGLFYYASIGWFLLHAWRTPRADYRVLAACLLVPVLVSFHDFALYLGWVRSDTYLLSLSSILTLTGIAFVVSYRFVAAMRQVESFNVELQREVDVATTQLTDTLQRGHALELAHSRAGERLQLVRDLHDGFGGTLVGAINQLEHAPEGMSRQQVVAVLKDMRDDLRLVIDSTARERADLAELLAPLRHRAGNLLEAAGIDSTWHFAGIDGLELGSARSLDLLRLLQEALTNVFKHSRARNAQVRVERIDDALHLRVRDDGQGLPPEDGAKPLASGGAGFASMRLRATRLGGQLQVQSAPGTTELRLTFPLTA